MKMLESVKQISAANDLINQAELSREAIEDIKHIEHINS